jgi:hypothetical protein
MDICARVLAFVTEFHLRNPACEYEEAIEAGEYHVLRTVQEALEKQAHALQTEAREEVANG